MPGPRELGPLSSGYTGPGAGTKTVAAVADVILGEIRGLLLTFQNFRQATLHTVDINDNLISPFGVKAK